MAKAREEIIREAISQYRAQAKVLLRKADDLEKHLRESQAIDSMIGFRRRGNPEQADVSEGETEMLPTVDLRARPSPGRATADQTQRIVDIAHEMIKAAKGKPVKAKEILDRVNEEGITQEYSNMMVKLLKPHTGIVNLPREGLIFKNADA